MKIIAKYEGGSKSYGLNNQDSDLDIRGCFLNTEISKIIGLSRHEHENKMDAENDVQLFELRHFLNLLRKGNTQCLEMLHNDVWLEKSIEFDYIQAKKCYLLDSEKIYKCFRAYSFSERNLIFGRAHLGRIGEKRKKAIETFGYSYRNCCHAFRLLRSAIIFFKEDYFPVNISECDKEFGAMIRDIKFNPEKYQPEKLEANLIDLEKELDYSFEQRKTNYIYNEEVANKICFELYMPILKNFKT